MSLHQIYFISEIYFNICNTIKFQTKIKQKNYYSINDSLYESWCSTFNKKKQIYLFRVVIY